MGSHVLLRHRLLPQSNRLQRLGAVEVVVGLNDQPVSQPVYDGERLRVWRVRTLPDHSGASHETAVGQLDQIIEMDLDRSDQIDQALHPGERSDTPPDDSDIGPARFSARGLTAGRCATERPPLAERNLSVDGILGPELLRDRPRTRLVPDLVRPADSVSVLLDIAYSDSPTASRASSTLAYICILIACPSRNDHT